MADIFLELTELGYQKKNCGCEGASQERPKPQMRRAESEDGVWGREQHVRWSGEAL